MRHFLAISLSLLLLCLGPTSADPGSLTPWAQPVEFKPDPQKEEHVPIFERAMREERRLKERGINDPVRLENVAPRPSSEPPRSDPQSVPATTAEPVAPSFENLAQGSRGQKVEDLQNALISLGFGLPAGADGSFGGQTVSAVKAFQSSQAIPETGEVDEDTFRRLSEARPEHGKAIWEDPRSAKTIPQPPEFGERRARVLIDLSEHRLSVFDSKGELQRVFPVASGALDTPTDPGIKVVTEKLADPTKLAEKLWPESKGGAFGKRLIDLNWYDPERGVQTVSDEELHGTYVRNSIGAYASHGCVRLTNDNIEWLFHNLKVGDIVVIQK